MNSFISVVFSLFLLSIFFSFSSCSLGDSSWGYRVCRLECTERCVNDGYADFSAGHEAGFLGAKIDINGRPITGVRRPFDLSLQLFQWDCDSECGYRCMRLIHEDEQAKGISPKKYHGTWPFLRVFGHQEFFSALFSWLNAVPHVYFGLKFYRSIPRFYSLYWLWVAFAVLGVNTWLWSAVFHTRDTPLTEKLDYYSAWLGILYAGACFIIRAADLRTTFSRFALLGGFASFFVLHVSYMHFIRFDYGWNMMVTAGSGILLSIFVILWGFGSGLRHTRPLAIAYCCLVAASLLEIFDFSPFFDLLDSHAIWHALTPPVGVAMWKFILEDAAYQLNRGDQSVYQKVNQGKYISLRN